MSPSRVRSLGCGTAWLRGCFAALALVATGCGSASVPQPSVVPAAKPAQKPKLTDADQLHQLLTAISPPPPVLDALPPDARQELQRQRSALSPEQQQLLLLGGDPIVALRPLLYLAAGGTDLQVGSLVFRSSAGCSELVALLGDKDEYPGLVAACNEMGRRAALQLLGARAVDLVPGVERKAEHLQQVALAARLLERVDIERLALRVLALESEQPWPWEIALSELEARALDPAQARAHLATAAEQARGALAPGATDAVPGAAAAQMRAAAQGAQVLIAAAEFAAKTQTELPNLDARVQAARASLELGLPERARQQLQSDAAELGRHLAYTTTVARALTQGNACPNVWPTLVNERVCRQAWAEALPTISAETLDKAWATELGRDAWAVETYLGLSYVVPMLYGLDRAGKGAELSTLDRNFAELAQHAEEARSSGEDLGAIALVARALGVAVASVATHQGQPTVIEPKQRQALLSAAEAQATPDASPWARTAALAVAAILAQHEPIAPLLDRLRQADLGSAKLTYGSLLLWDMLAQGNSARYAQFKSLFADLAVATDAAAFERSTWLFTWAEAEAHLVPGEQSTANLDRIASTLLRTEAPLELRLRATLDRAGLLARKDDFVAAAALLEPIVTQTPRSSVGTAAEQELLVASTGYLLVVRALQAKGAERVDYAKKLQAFLLDVTRANAAPPTLQMWLLMWSAELDALLQREACKGLVACERRVDRVRGAEPAKVTAALGARVTGLLQHGVVPVGAVQVEIRYQPSGHLSPQVQVTPAFLLTHVPKLAPSKR